MSSSPLKEAEFKKIEEINPNDVGINLKLSVCKVENLLTKVKDDVSTKVADVLVGDETGMIKMRVRGDYVDAVSKVHNQIIVRNGFINMIKNHMRLQIDSFGKISIEKNNIVLVNTENNLSNVEYELVSIPNTTEKPEDYNFNRPYNFRVNRNLNEYDNNTVNTNFRASQNWRGRFQRGYNGYNQRAQSWGNR